MIEEFYQNIHDFIRDTLNPTISCLTSYLNKYYITRNPQIHLNGKSELSREQLEKIIRNLLKRCIDIKDALYDLVNNKGVNDGG